MQITECTMAGNELCLKTTDYVAARRFAYGFKPGDYEIDKRKKKRSNDANALCWKLCTEIANALRTDKESIYVDMLKSYGQSDMWATRKATGIDITGFGNEIKANSIRHIEKGHGINGDTDHTMQNDNDIARMQYVLDNYDSVQKLGNNSNEYRDKNGKPAPLVQFSKRIDGMYYVVEAVPDTNKQKLEVVSAYKFVPTKKEASQQTVDVQAPTWNVRNASPDNASANSISQDGGNVNESVQTVGETSETETQGAGISYVDDEGKKLDKVTVDKIKARSIKLADAKSLFIGKTRFFKGLIRLGEGLGVNIKVFDGEALNAYGVDGFYDKKSRTIYLNHKNPMKPVQATVRHEVIHVFRQMTEKGFQTFSDYVVEKYKARHGAEAFDAWIANKITEYSNLGQTLTRDGAIEEFCADIGMDILNHKAEVNAFIARNKGVAEKLRDALRQVLNIVRKAFRLSENVSLTDAIKELASFDSTVSTIDGKVERRHTPYGYDGLPGTLSVSALNRAQELLMEGIAEYEQEIRAVWNKNGKELDKLSPAQRKTRLAELVSERMEVGKSTGNTDGIIMSAVRTKNGSVETVVIKENIFKGRDGEKRENVVKKYLTQHIGEYATIIESGQKVYFGEELPGEYVHSVSAKNNPKRIKTAKNRAVVELVEIIENSTNRKWEKNKKHKHRTDAKYGWYKYDAKFRIKDVKTKDGIKDLDYTAEVLIRNDANGKKYLYDVQKIKEVTPYRGDAIKSEPQHATAKGSAVPRDNLKNSVTNTDKNVKRNFSKQKNSEKSTDILFSLSKPVETTKDLVALHNMTEEKLFQALKLGGMPMPSIAITKNEGMHTDFGDITLIFDKKSIDPQADSRNKVYSSDIHSQTFPWIKHELNEKKCNELAKELAGLVESEEDKRYIYENFSKKELTRLFDILEGTQNVVSYFMKHYQILKAFAKQRGEFIQHLSSVDEQDFIDWLSPKLEAVVSRRGISNGKAPFTASGKKRTFAQLHYPITLDNVLRVMLRENSQGSEQEIVNAKTIRAVSAQVFSSIAEIHENSQRIKKLPKKDVENLWDSYNVRLEQIQKEICSKSFFNTNYYLALEEIGDIIAEAARKTNYSVSSISRTLGKYNKFNSKEISTKIKALFDDIQKMPVNIFEAKPRRIVGFDEVRLAVVPENTDTELIERLKLAGVGEVVTYGKGNEQARVEAINSNSDVMFSTNGYIPKGENPARDIDVPAKDNQDRKVSHGIRTVLEAGATPDSYVSPIMDDILDGKYSHDVITDEEAQESAFRKISHEVPDIDENGKNTGKTKRVLNGEKYKRALRDVLERFENGKLDGKYDVALLQALYTNAANSYDYMSQMDVNGVPLAEKLVVAMVQTASKAGQTLQVSRLLKKTSPAGKLYDLEMLVKNMNKEIKNQWGEWVDKENAEIENQWGKYEDGKRNYKVDKAGKKRRKDSRRRGRSYTKTQKDIVLDQKLVEQLLSAKNQEEANAIEEKIIKDVAGQIEATVVDKIRALRYTAMLCNPRTHVRNILGNALFAGVVKTRNALDASLQSVFVKDKSKRTKTFSLTSTQKVEQNRLIAYADKLFNEQMQYVRGENGKYDTFNGKIDENRKIFGWAPLEGARKINSNLLETEDVFFLRRHFNHHFANALLAKGITVSDLENGKVSRKLIEETMKYAAEQAQKATFRDANNLAKAINNMAKTNAFTDVAVAGVLPFKQTPMNILMRGIEYSPASIVKATWRAISENVSVKKGTLDSVDVAGILENLSEGLTGSMLFAVGAWLLRIGVLTIRPGDDEEEKLGEAMGHQSYALEIGGYSFTIDWAAPAVMPLFMGAECAKSLEDGMGINALELLAKISNPVIETSMLSGILGVLDSIRYSESDSDVLVDLSTEVMSSYLMQYFPSILGAVARTVDEVESRTSRPSKAGDEGFLEMLGRKIANKVPILRNIVGNKPYVDIMGKYETKDDVGDYIVSALQNFILPGYISRVSSSKATTELSSVALQVERTDFIPKYVTKINEHRLTHNEYYNFHVERGELYDAVIPHLNKQGWYRKCTAEQKAEILTAFKEAADKLTKKSFLPKGYSLNNKTLERIYNNGSHADDIVGLYLCDKYIGMKADVNRDDKIEKSEYVNFVSGMDVDNDDA